MTGIMEQVLSELVSIKAILSGASQQVQSDTAKQEQKPAQQPDSASQLVGAGPATNGSGALTEDTLMSLIEPHLENMTIKTGLQGVLAQMGIARLPEARPDQYQELYNRFTAVIQQNSPHTLGSSGSSII